MNLVAQFVKVIWGKAQRGGQGAAKRNGVATQTKLPPEVENHAAGKALVHRIVYSQINDFARPVADELKVFEIKELKNIGCFQFKPSADKLEVIYRWSRESGGAPARIKYDQAGTKIPLKETAFTLRLNEIGKAEYNARFGDYEWRYEKLTLNIGVFETVDTAVFRRRNYDHYYRQLADLR